MATSSPAGRTSCRRRSPTSRRRRCSRRRTARRPGGAPLGEPARSRYDAAPATPPSRARPAMKRPDPATTRADFDRNAFLVLLVVLTVAFAWILWPYYGGVFWGAVLALLFEPMYRRLVVRFRGRRNLAALTTIAVILVMVILPVVLVSISLVREASGLYHRIKSGQLD